MDTISDNPTRFSGNRSGQKPSVLSAPRWILFAAFTLLVSHWNCPASTIDFTPVTGTRVLEGVSFPELLFTHGGRKISYEPPRGWSYSGSGPRLRLSPPDVTHGQAIIDAVPLPSVQPLNEVAAQQLPSQVLASLPENATNVQITEEEICPVRVKEQESREFYATYNYLGWDYETSVIFANVGDVQLRFRLVARKGSFELLHRAFRGSIFSLRWL
jgi:hypothetical protein